MSTIYKAPDSQILPLAHGIPKAVPHRYCIAIVSPTPPRLMETVYCNFRNSRFISAKSSISSASCLGRRGPLILLALKGTWLSLRPVPSAALSLTTVSLLSFSLVPLGLLVSRVCFQTSLPSTVIKTLVLFSCCQATSVPTL